MPKTRDEALSRRERQIIDVLYRLGEGTVTDVCTGLDDPPSYSAIRTTLGVLEEKGVVRHRREGRRFVYRPKVSRQRARQSALRRVLETFFEGSAEGAVAALLELKSTELTPDALERIQRLIDDAREEGR